MKKRKKIFCKILKTYFFTEEKLQKLTSQMSNFNFLFGLTKYSMKTYKDSKQNL